QVVSVVYFVKLATQFLENGLQPASFLPGESLLLLAGALIDQDVMHFLTKIGILNTEDSLGCCLSYIKVRLICNTRTFKGW
ncbi:DedA family protein, partial [Salmonella enterica]